MSIFDTLKNRVSQRKAGPAPAPHSQASQSVDGDNDPASSSVSLASEGLEGPRSVMIDLAAQQDHEVALPLLGKRQVVKQRSLLVGLLCVSLAVLAVLAYLELRQSDRSAQQVAATGQALMQSQRLAKSVSQALVGAADAFPDVKDSTDVLAANLRGLREGDAQLNLAALGEGYQDALGKITPLVDRAGKNAKIVMDQQKVLTQVNTCWRLPKQWLP